MKIFYQYSTLKSLKPTKGDRINEINLLKALSQFAQVYYSGQLFKPNVPGYGLRDYPGRINVVSADWSIIRANRKVFNLSAGKRMWISSPFDKDCFEKADKIGTFTRTWQNYLRQGRNMGPLNPGGIKWGKAVSLFQSLSPEFRPLGDASKVMELKQKIGGRFIIGCFGRVVKSNYPQLLINSIPYLKKYVPGIKLVFGISGNGMKIKPSPEVVLMNFPHNEMPHVLNACDCIVVSQRGPEWEFCGNLKSLEPMACGTPVICQRSDARQEMFGKNYPLFLERGSMDDFGNRIHISKLVELVSKLQNISYKNMVGLDLVKKAEFYSIQNSAKRLKEILK